MSIEKKSLISTLSTTKKAKVASGTAPAARQTSKVVNKIVTKIVPKVRS